VTGGRTEAHWQGTNRWNGGRIHDTVGAGCGDPTRLDIGAGDLAWAPVTEELRHHDKLRPLRVGQSIDAGEYVFDTTVWVSWAKNPLQTA
jgi:hypothetical protein